MIYVTDIKEAHPAGDTIITLGKFDGLHRGHQQLFRSLQDIKAETGWSTVAFTFNMELLRWRYGKSFQCVLEPEERKVMFETLGLDLVVECPFTEEIRNMEAETFVEEYLVNQLHARYIVIGKDFRFGHNRKGDYQLLLTLAKRFGFEVQLIQEVYDEGETERISSTRIRKALEEGRIEDANRMLGYPYSVEGMIEHGEQLGRTIDMPTINLTPSASKLLPPFGVYTSITEIDGRQYPGVTNIGKKPTVGKFSNGVETHLLDINEDLYGRYAKVRIYHYQRPEQKFGSIQELKDQMHRDRVNARTVIAGMKDAL